MGRSAGVLKSLAQVVFYLAVLALLAGRGFSAAVSHDEIQFVAPGQLLVAKGLLPYLDYPYTHMPYAIPFYALSALASGHDFLAARMINSLAWLGCILLMVAIARAMRRNLTGPPTSGVSWKELLWEFGLVLVFVNHGPATMILSAALNHSLATFLALLSIWFLVLGLGQPEVSRRDAFLSGASMAAAGLTRFNFAGLAIIVLIGWALAGLWVHRGGAKQLLWKYVLGGIVAGVPVIVLAAAAPRQFFYSNFVYIRLNTIYYEELLHRVGMTLADKLGMFVGGILRSPLEVLLYAILLLSCALAVKRLAGRRSSVEIVRLAVAGAAVGLWLSALAPTPGLIRYFAGPVPFLFILLGAFDLELGQVNTPGRALGAIAVFATALLSDGIQGTERAFTALGNPSGWPPVQMHALAAELNRHLTSGRVLTLNPMLVQEAGYDIYPFTVNGPFIWRTSLLLTAERREEYGVISPEELPGLMEETRPDGILVGFEAPNAGFERGEQGGLEEPFSEYAIASGYRSVKLTPGLYPRGLTLWIRP